MSNYAETVETAKTGRDLRKIIKDLLGISAAEIVAGNVVSSYGQTEGGAADSTNGGIILDAAVRENGGTGLITHLIFREVIAGSGALQKAALRVHYFSTYSLSLASNNAYALDGTTNGKKVVTFSDIAESDWEELDAFNAMAIVTVPKDIWTAADTTALKAVVEMKSTAKTYSADHSLQMELHIHRD